MYGIFLFLVPIAPTLFIMTMLVSTKIPLYFAFLDCLPFSIAGSWLMVKWTLRQDVKRVGRKDKIHVSV